MAGIRIATAAALGAALLVLVASGRPAGGEAPKDIGATGVIEPHGGVVSLSGVPGATILAIEAHVGEVVKRGQVLMTLDDRPARVDAGLALIDLARARRRAAQAIADEAASLQLAQDRARRAEVEAAAYRSLGPESTSLRQTADFESAAEEAETGLDIERRKTFQVRSDAAADLSAAEQRYGLSRAKLAAYQVTAPSDGVILAVSQHVGETLSDVPALRMGDLSSMYVSCDAFQGDLLKIAPGMLASVSSNAFRGALSGHVEWVSRLVDTKSETGKFKVKLDDPALAGRLVGMEVDVKVVR